MHWDHEPKMRNLFICKGSILRFMESLHGFLTAHWENEPRQLLGHGVLTAPPPGGGLGTARPTSRFRESPHDFDAVHWDNATSDCLESRLHPVQTVQAA